MRQQIDLIALITVLEMPKSCLDFLALDYQAAVSGLQGFKAAVKKQRRLLAIQYHPDKEDGNDKRMKEINAAVDLLLKLAIERPQPQSRTIIVQVFGFHSYSGGTSTVITAF